MASEAWATAPMSRAKRLIFFIVHSQAFSAAGGRSDCVAQRQVQVSAHPRADRALEVDTLLAHAQT